MLFPGTSVLHVMRATAHPTFANPVSSPRTTTLFPGCNSGVCGGFSSGVGRGFALIGDSFGKRRCGFCCGKPFNGQELDVVTCDDDVFLRQVHQLLLLTASNLTGDRTSGDGDNQQVFWLCVDDVRLVPRNDLTLLILEKRSDAPELSCFLGRYLSLQPVHPHRTLLQGHGCAGPVSGSPYAR